MKPIAFKRLDDDELFTLNDDSKTYSMENMKKDFPNSFYLKYRPSTFNTLWFEPIYSNESKDQIITDILKQIPDCGVGIISKTTENLPEIVKGLISAYNTLANLDDIFEIPPDKYGEDLAYAVLNECRDITDKNSELAMANLLYRKALKKIMEKSHQRKVLKIANEALSYEN